MLQENVNFKRRLIEVARVLDSPWFCCMTHLQLCPQCTGSFTITLQLFFVCLHPRPPAAWCKSCTFDFGLNCKKTVQAHEPVEPYTQCAHHGLTWQWWFSFELSSANAWTRKQVQECKECLEYVGAQIAEHRLQRM